MHALIIVAATSAMHLRFADEGLCRAMDDGGKCSPHIIADT
jgi:hypothetical protein